MTTPSLVEPGSPPDWPPTAPSVPTFWAGDPPQASLLPLSRKTDLRQLKAGEGPGVSPANTVFLPLSVSEIKNNNRMKKETVVWKVAQW